jgi:hypothetical protein
MVIMARPLLTGANPSALQSTGSRWGAELDGVRGAMRSPFRERAQSLGLVDEALFQHRRLLIRPCAEQLEHWCGAVAWTLSVR